MQTPLIHKKIKKSILIAIISSFIMGLIKLFFGILSGSLVVITQALDSAFDFFVSIGNYFIVSNSEKKETKKFNYGLGKLQGIGAFIEGAFIVSSGLLMIYLSIQRLISGDIIQNIEESILGLVITTTILAGVVWYMREVAKETDHITHLTDYAHYKTDFIADILLIFSLIMIKLTGFHIIDTIIPLFVGLYKIYICIPILKRSTGMLLDRQIDDEKLKILTSILSGESHKIKSRISGQHIFIDIFLQESPNISLKDFSQKRKKLIKQIHTQIPNSIVNINFGE